MSSTTVECGLGLVIEASGSAAAQISAAFDVAAVASVVIRPGAESERLQVGEVRALVELVQLKGTAALIENDWRLARTLRADGVHLAEARGVADAYREAREVLGGRYIVGAYAGKSRHDAMTLAEEGADYVAFGAPESVQDREHAKAKRLELVQWWGEIFEVACLALDVDTAEDAAALRAARADFVAVTIGAGATAAEVRDTVGAIAHALKERP